MYIYSLTYPRYICIWLLSNDGVATSIELTLNEHFTMILLGRTMSHVTCVNTWGTLGHLSTLPPTVHRSWSNARGFSGQGRAAGSPCPAPGGVDEFVTSCAWIYDTSSGGTAYGYSSYVVVVITLWLWFTNVYHISYGENAPLFTLIYWLLTVVSSSFCTINSWGVYQYGSPMNFGWR